MQTIAAANNSFDDAKGLVRMVTIHDVAKKANVSPATISRVINGGPVSSKMKAKVLRVIEQMNYVPDARATSLKRDSAHKIGLVVPDIMNPFYPTLVSNIHRQMKENGYPLILGNTYGSMQDERDILQMMQRERVSGIFLATCEGEDDSELKPLFESLIQRNVSIVFLGKQNQGLPVDVVAVDNISGSYKAVEYLIRTGRKKIGFLAARMQLSATIERLDGYRKAFAEKGVDIDESRICCEGEFTIESGERWGGRLLESADIDAVFCGNDLLAIGLMKAAERLGKKIPDDVAVVGFDDSTLAPLVTPKLTTIRQPQAEVAQIASDIILKRMKGEIDEPPREVFLEPELIVRESA